MSAGSVPGSAAPVHELEVRSLRAWPGEVETRLGGWELRATGGYTRRANSANPLGHPGVPVADAVTHVREWFHAHGLPAVFKMTQDARPAELDAFLADAGWARVAPALVMTQEVAAAAEAPFPDGFHLALDSEPERDWLDAFARWNELSAAATDLHRSIVARIAPMRALARVRGPDGVTRSIGLAVADGVWVGLFDLVTDPAYRSLGIGRAVVAALLSWGERHGARTAYLQVMQQNVAAHRLYRRLGFADAYVYWYRVAPESPPGNRDAA